MGLTISLRKPERLGDRNPDEIDQDDVHILENDSIADNKLRQKFGGLIFKKTISYYDNEGSIKERGYTLEQLEQYCTEYGEDVIFKYKDTLHPLYEVSKYLNEVWHQTYFDSEEELFKSDHYATFVEKYLGLLLKNGWTQEYEFYASGNKKTYWNLVPAHKFCEDKIDVQIVNPPLIDKQEDCILDPEVKWQSKGHNSRFNKESNDMYDRLGEGLNVITTMDELKEHWDKYFSATSVLRENFKKNIIDHFIEGTHYVCYV